MVQHGDPLQPSPTHPPGHNHGDWFNQALECHQLVEAEHFTGGHIQPMLGHDTYEERHGFMGTFSVPTHCLMFLCGGKIRPEDRG